MTPQTMQGNFSPCRIIMAAGKWLVPEVERPKLAPPPVERTPLMRAIDRWLSETWLRV